MFFNRVSTIAVATVFIWTNFAQVTATNQALADCELQCSQRWAFPAPAPPSPSGTPPHAESKPTSTHTSASSQPPLTDYAPAPATTSEVPPSPPVESTSSAKKHVAVITSSSSSYNPPSTTRAPPAATTTPAPPVATTTPAPPVATTTPAPPVATTSAKPTSTPDPDDTPKSVASSPSIDAYLAPHNAARAAHGANPLSWSDELAAAAQRWANNCVFEHSGGSLGPFGENLAAGSGDYSAESGVKAWVDEAPEYNSANPVPSHFTQVVWKGTTQVGCAVASCNLANFDPQFWPVKFHVCEYSSPGNVIGQFAANVQA